MNFYSIQYFLFLIIVFLAYWFSPSKWRWVILLTSSIFYYCLFSITHSMILLLIGLFVYLCGLRINNDSKHSKSFLWIGNSVLIGTLVYFKYANWFISEISSTFHVSIHLLNIIIPVGISFYIFRFISYLTDIYHKKMNPEKHIGYFMTYVFFFPIIISGPIIRAKDFFPQLKACKEFNYARASYGIKIVSWGYFMKILIADKIAPFVNNIFSTEAYGFAVFLGIILYTLQIYFDFAGYSNIAIGISNLFGFDVKKNFNAPYLATSIGDFWNRWHISLSSWLKDYVYIPLGGNRKGKVRSYINLFITFLISGIWHGAGMTYIVWGMLHGIYRCVEKLLSLNQKNHNKILIVMKRLIVFILVSFAWLFFRADSIQQAFGFLSRIFIGIDNLSQYFWNGLEQASMPFMDVIKICFFSSFVFIYDVINNRENCINLIGRFNTIIRWMIYLGITGSWMLYLILQVVDTSTSSFIYFDF